MTDGMKRQGRGAVSSPRMALAPVALASAALALSLVAGNPSVMAQENGTPASPPPASRPLDFRLPPADDGRTPGVQGPADNGLPPVGPAERPAAQTAPPPPRVVPTQPAESAQPAPATTKAIRQPAPPGPRNPDVGATGPAAPAAQESPPPQPGADQPAAPVEAAPSAAIAVADQAQPPRAAPPRTGTPLWAWIMAVLAALGAGFWYWRRRAAPGVPTIDEVDDAPLPATPHPAAPRPAPRAALPSARPAAPPPAAPAAPAPVASPQGAGPAASPLVTRAVEEKRAIVGMALEILSIRVQPDHVVVGFALNLVNQGSAAATGLMVRIALNQGSAMPEAVLGRFFDGAGGSVLRDDITLAPGAGEQLSSEAMLSRAGIEPLMMGGRGVLVPVMAFDVTYHWDGEGDAFGQNAGSFVVGRELGADKLAPLPLDRATYVVDRPGARSTAIRRTQ
ncbi:MAG: hypothetical protein KYX64_02725 [Sphingopyxis sp.]|nr:hypothetical protein [Sphingopyxis sp.]